MKIGMFLASVGSDSGGPERYETELVKNLAAIDKHNEYEMLTLFPKAPERLVKQENFRCEVLTPQNRTVSMLTSLPKKMRRSSAQAWHATYVPPPFSPRDYMFTLVCSSMIEKPELYPPAVRLRLVALTNRAIQKAGLIICISDHIRQVVKDRYRVSDDRLEVIHLGVSEAFQAFDKAEAREFVKQAYGIERPYFLFSGRWEARKNIIRIIEAFGRFKREVPSDIQLVFTGESTWSANEARAAIRDNKLENDVLDLGKSPVDELPKLYSGALALVYPSLWEGFGLPIVEGMAAGIPVITSNNSSMVEIAGNAALLVDPYSVDSIVEAMVSVAASEELRESMREKGLARASEFTWRSTAEQTLALYQQHGECLQKIA